MFMILLLASSALLAISISNVNAANIQTYAYISVAPNPIGVGQTAHVSVWINNYPPQLPGMAYKDMGYHNFTVIITRPDGTTQTWGPIKSDPIGAQWFDFVPTTVGTYYLIFNYPGETMGNTFLPSSSSKIPLTVQTDEIKPWPGAPLPTGYWERPVEADNREWYQISGNVLGGYDTSLGIFNPYTKAPNTAHIVWTKEVAFGGLIGGAFGSDNYYTGLSYEDKWSNPIIINGRLFYNQRFSSSGAKTVVCVDLRTGEQFWTKNYSYNLGQVLQYDTQNQHGGIPYLWQTGTTFNMYDAYTGDLVLSIPGATTGTTKFDQNGNMLVYILRGANNWLAMWNSTLCIGKGKPAAGSGFGAGDPDYWRPNAAIAYNWTDGIQWNVTVPDVAGAQSIAKMDDEVIYARSTLQSTPTNIVCDVGYDAKTGAQLWVQNRTEQPSRTTGDMHNGVFIEYVKETMVWYGYNAKTGSLMWGPTEPRESGWGVYYTGGTSLGGPGAGAFSAYGKFYSTTYDGKIYCYNITTGKLLWTYFTGSSGFETPYGWWPFGGGQMAVADGKVFVVTSEHSPNTPLYRGERLHVVDTNTGEAVWTVTGWWQVPIIADGYVVAYNGYDNRLYCFGKGKTDTTISASPKVSTQGSTILVEGTVSDLTPSIQNTPAISDADMTPWMEYMYMQKPKPTNATGVKVFLQAIKSDGTIIDIWHATTDIMGHYEYAWNPPTTDTYKIIATFEGSEAYWESANQCGLSVVSAPSPSTINVPSANEVADQVISQLPVQTPAPTAPSASDVANQVLSQLPANNEMVIIAAVAVAILIGIVNLVLLLRKKQA
jgi:outer membrane protein assembly factor BamB